MGRYNEQATMLIDGVAYPVHAKLEGYFESEETQSFSGKSRVRGHPVWGGTVQTNAQDLTWTIHNAEELILRAEDGREGPFTVSDDNGEGVLRIRGNGRAPFDI
ncbi:DUF4873 domain-containing protein [Streptomyces sp. LUP47B]|uniref:DUF4873 domain-containing protein n=1 Tax=Streptomyces sp. LUP47B TaxID=1890286 RepID=UPI00085159BA|nr:DUF4873 domain-containing protein [Streptomyces sp. LUP47B]